MEAQDSILSLSVLDSCSQDHLLAVDMRTALTETPTTMDAVQLMYTYQDGAGVFQQLLILLSQVASVVMSSVDLLWTAQ